MEGLMGTEIHGFRTMRDLDMENIMMEAKGRWLRPNEIHAILSNYKHFTVRVKPVNLPPSGMIVLFDRKMLRNFRKDGHNWKKKKDGKTVKEAHEHLKVGNEERIHVYYAHGEDNPTFVRRCYWLLDKSLEHIVLVHYRETQELQGSPVTPVNSHSSSGISDPSASWVVSEESDSAANHAYYSSERADLGLNQSMNIKDHELRLHEINTLEWDDLVVDDPNKLIAPQQGRNASGQSYPYEMVNYGITADSLPASNFPAEGYMEKFHGQGFENMSDNLSIAATVSFQAVGDKRTSNIQQKETRLVTTFSGGYSSETMGKDNLQTQDSFGRWINDVIADSPLSIDDTALGTSVSTQQSFASPNMDSPNLSVVQEIFYITDISPSWAFANEEAKILVVGFFLEGQANIEKSNLSFVCGDACIPAETVQSGVFRCLLPPQAPGAVNLFLSFDGQRPISQAVMFEFRAPMVNKNLTPFEDNPTWQEFEVQMRLAHLLFSTSRSLNILSTTVRPTAMKEAKRFSRKTNMEDDWRSVIKSIKAKDLSYLEAKNRLIELTLQNRLREWLLERVVEGCKIAERDEQGQGAIHLCAILGYTWAVYPFSWSGLSLDYRDKFGWTALHWAAYYGREAMVAKLLSAGAKAYFVTDPTSENSGGFTAADLASKNGYDGLAAYLAEKALVQHFQDMTLAGNVSGSLQTITGDSVDAGNFNDDELYLKDTLAAYRTAADAAARIQAAFREHSLKVRTTAIESSNPEIEARNIVAAMKIQHAFRNYDTRKKMVAAARIQHRFRTWKMRRDFLNMRKQAIRIQAVFRGFQVRRQYRKIIWSVGVLEKAILRWRLKRKGFRGLQVQPDKDSPEQKQPGNVEEDFFEASRKQAEARVERSVVRVQSMFRSKRAQEAYRRMKLAHNSATLEYEELQDPNEMADD